MLLWQALDEEGSVSIFQTVSDLRRQRNYLVQSVKQYQFVYRSVPGQVLHRGTKREPPAELQIWIHVDPHHF
jgi:hypothetical protein